MKRFFGLILFSLLITITAVAQGLPVLEVSFPAGSLTGEYIQGEMILTDIDGSSVNLPARLKTRGATAKKYTMKP